MRTREINHTCVAHHLSIDLLPQPIGETNRQFELRLMEPISTYLPPLGKKVQNSKTLSYKRNHETCNFSPPLLRPQLARKESTSSVINAST